MTLWWAEYAWLGGDGAERGVLIDTVGDRVARVSPGNLEPASGARVLRGLTLPGLVNAHSHAFHRALRGHTQAERGSFWSWRERMYAVSALLQPDSYYRLARAAFAEMLLAGITTVGEFHYLHHDSGGVPYSEPTAMAAAVVRAARDAGIRITLLDTCYLVGGFGPAGGVPHLPLSSAQRRFGDGTAAAWAERATRTRSLLESDTVRVGAAVHSVRAVPADQLRTVAEWAHRNNAPIHAHVSEQPAENADCLRVYAATPTQLLASAGVLDRLATAVHLTHPGEADLALLASHDTSVCLCVTTERDLADGMGPGAALAAHRVPLTLGSDSQAVIDLLEEARGVELQTRLATNFRGHFSAAELLRAATANGADCLGWPSAGRISVGSLADFITLDLRSVRTAGHAAATVLETALFAASAADVTTVVVGGRVVVDDRVHLGLPDVAGELHRSISTLTSGEDLPA